MIRRCLPFVILALAAGCSGGGGGGDRLDRDILVQNLSGPSMEAGDAATFEIVLRAQPSADVVLGLSSDDTSEGVVFPESLTFTRFNWNAPQTVTVLGQDDLEDDGNVVFHVVVDPPQTNDAVYAGIAIEPVPITNIDDETASILVGPPSGSTTEEGGSATITLRLTSQPSADVTIPVVSNDTTEGTLLASSVVFSPLTWGTAQTVTITGADDVLADGNLAYTIGLSPAVSADPAYSGLTPVVTELTLLNVDDETPGITTSSSDTVTSESASTGSFDVRLNCQPANDVVLTFDVSDATEAMLSTTTLTFTPLDWMTPKVVIVTGADDMLTDGPQPFQVEFMPADSNDPAFDGLDTAPRAFVNLDNEQGGITVAPLVGVTTETGASHSFTVRLDGQPTDDVVIPLSSSDISEGTVSPSSLTFTAMDWDQPQTVTVTGVLDRRRDPNKRYWINFEPAVSNDAIYSGLRAQRVNMTSVDDGPAPLALVFDDGIATHATLAATTAAGLAVATAADATEFEAMLPDATLVIVELAGTVLPPSAESALAAWITSGGSAIVSYGDLSSSPALQAALQVSASAPHTTARDIFRKPGADPDLFSFSRSLATLIYADDNTANNGSALALTGTGSLPVRFDTGSGPGAVAITNEGRTIVNGFLPDNTDASDVDGDFRADTLELYENEVAYLTQPPFIRRDVNVPYALPDLSTTTSTVTISNFPEGVVTARLSMHAIHTFVGDLDISLIAPDGTTIDVISDLGAETHDLGTGCADNQRVLFSDDAESVMPTTAVGAPFTGSWRTEQSLVNLATTNPNGTWTLRIVDDGPSDIGSVECWSLFIVY